MTSRYVHAVPRLLALFTVYIAPSALAANTAHATLTRDEQRIVAAAAAENDRSIASAISCCALARRVHARVAVLLGLLAIAMPPKTGRHYSKSQR